MLSSTSLPALLMDRVLPTFRWLADVVVKANGQEQVVPRSELATRGVFLVGWILPQFYQPMAEAVKEFLENNTDVLGAFLFSGDMRATIVGHWSIAAILSTQRNRGYRQNGSYTSYASLS